MLQDMYCYHLEKNIKKQLFDTGLDSVKTASKKVVHQTVEFFGNKIAYAVTNSNDGKIEKQEPVKEIIIPLVKKEMKY